MANNSNARNPKVLHVLNRLSFGPRPGDVENVKSMGIEAYIKSQLSPNSIPESQRVRQQLSTLETLTLSPRELKAEFDRLRQTSQDPKVFSKVQNKWRKLIMDQAIQARFVRSMNSNRQLQEVMADFWFNHFNVWMLKGLATLWTGSYEEQAIRPHALGKFRQLLGSVAKHPAMLFYLDNWLNTAPGSSGVRGQFKGLNENYARELMELHTLGVDGGYTQQDVVALARILTGWGLERQKRRMAANPPPPTDSNGFFFDPDRHDFSDKVFLGKTIKGSGIAEGEEVLDLLSRHPSTARHISYKLAQYFVSDRPPAPLVAKLAKTFQEKDGDIKAVLNTLFSSQEFFDPKNYNAKFKTPYQYVISMVRATDTEIANFHQFNGFLTQMGMPVYGHREPDGYKNTEDAWLNPDALLRRIEFATRLGLRQLGKSKPLDVDRLSNTLGNNFSERTREVVASSNPKMQIALMLGSPEFMKR
jgi:uncharacterized protein (DUF1800 family)